MALESMTSAEIYDRAGATGLGPARLLRTRGTYGDVAGKTESARDRWLCRLDRPFN